MILVITAAPWPTRAAPMRSVFVLSLKKSSQPWWKFNWMYLYLYFTYNVNLSTRSWWWVSSWQSSWCSWPPFFSFSAGERQYHSEKLSPSQPTLTPSSPWPSSRRKLCPPCPCPQTPDKPVKQNNHELAAEKVLQMKLCSYFTEV